MVKMVEMNHKVDAPVLIVGAGPVGLSLALGLARLGMRSIVLERNASTSQRSKAPGIHVRTREIFRQWGVEERMLEAGTLLEHMSIHNAASDGHSIVEIDFAELEDEVDRPGILILEQGETERLLLEAVEQTGLCDVRFDTEVIELTTGEHGVEVRVRSPGGESSVRATYLVGCDGARSFVRQALGLDFEGMTYSVRPMLADVKVTDVRDELPWPRMFNGPDGITTAIRLRPGHWRIIRLESSEKAREAEVTKEEMRARMSEVLGDGPFEITWASRFRIHLRHVSRFRVGRVLLAGDAAHVHSPAGGLGMNAGIQDANNLAWKLAHVLAGGDAERLLDSYDEERQAVVIEDVSQYADWMTRIFLMTPRIVRSSMFAMARGLFVIPQARRRWMRRATMIDLAYPTSPLLNSQTRGVGKRLPNPVLYHANGARVRLHDLLSYAPALLWLGQSAQAGDGNESVTAMGIETEVHIGPGGYEDRDEILHKLVGQSDGWILVRPDAHISWVGQQLEELGDGLDHALGCSPSVMHRVYGQLPDPAGV